MNKIIKDTIISILIVYIVTSYVCSDFNPFNLSVYYRIAQVILVIIVNFFGTSYRMLNE